MNSPLSNTPEAPLPNVVPSVNRHARWRRRLAWLGGTVAVLAALWWSGPGNPLGVNAPAERTLPPAELTALDDWLQRSESAWTDLKPDTGKRIVWAQERGRKTTWSVVYVHGFSASRLETAPLAETVANQLGANLFSTRLTGHGRSAPEALGDARAQDWMADVREAVAIGQALGDQVLLIGCSTGATLATWIALRPEGRPVTAHVYVSPNYGPKNKASEIINTPWGPHIALALEGEMRGKPSGNADEARGWTERYPTRALFPMMALVKTVRDSDLNAFQAPVLMLYSEADQTVEPERTRAVFARIGSPSKSVQIVDYSESRGQHVLAGDIRAPRSTARMAESIVTWVRSLPRP